MDRLSSFGGDVHRFGATIVDAGRGIRGVTFGVEFGRAGRTGGGGGLIVADTDRTSLQTSCHYPHKEKQRATHVGLEGIGGGRLLFKLPYAFGGCGLGVRLVRGGGGGGFIILLLDMSDADVEVRNVGPSEKIRLSTAGRCDEPEAAICSNLDRRELTARGGDVEGGLEVIVA